MRILAFALLLASCAPDQPDEPVSGSDAAKNDLFNDIASEAQPPKDPPPTGREILEAQRRLPPRKTARQPQPDKFGEDMKEIEQDRRIELLELNRSAKR